MSVQQAIVFSADYGIMIYTAMTLFSDQARTKEGLTLQTLMCLISAFVLLWHIFTVK